MGVMGIKKSQQLILKAVPLPQTSVPAAGPTSQLLWVGGFLWVSCFDLKFHLRSKKNTQLFLTKPAYMIPMEAFSFDKLMFSKRVSARGGFWLAQAVSHILTHYRSSWASFCPPLEG